MTTLTQTRTVVLSSSSASPLQFDMFDPSLGTLDNARIDIAVTTGLDVSAENLDLGGVTLDATAVGSGQLRLDRASFMVLASAKGAGSTALGAFDGSTDFSGTSGIAQFAVSGSGSGSGEILTLDSLTGNGLLDATAWVPTTIDISAGAGLRVLTDVSSTFEATLTYDYTPFFTETVGSVTKVSPPPTFDVVATPSSFTAPTVTTTSQWFSFATMTTGWSNTATVAQFNPALGTLRSVNLLVSASLNAKAALESHEPSSNWTLVNQSVTTTVTAAGISGQLAGTTLGTSRGPTYLTGFDGTDDFSGYSGAVLTSPTLFGSSYTQVSSGATLAAFIGTGAIDLGLHAAGGSTIDGYIAELLAELTATSDATLLVSYTYEPSTPVTPILVETKSGVTTPTPTEYTGPVAGVFNEFAQITPENVAISINTDGWYVRTGDGDDAIRAVGGVNVLDGGRGSNFLTGGAGQDTFFVDAQWVSAPTWSTVVDLMPGDAVTVWGLTGSEQVNFWRDNEGAAGATGLTLHARMPFSPFVSVTLAGYSKADLDSGRLVTSYGTSDDVPYFYIRAA
jgi:hypothetical protein